MGKGSKALSRKDEKYYRLAREHGYRSRAAFKLIQLDKKFDLLNSAKVCVDLCAAPGGWMQVCQQFMPVASIIVGVDLVPIKGLPNCTSFAEDITTPQCLKKLKNHLQGWEADLVLHDGAPNMGSAWIQDAFEQNNLVLMALGLATKLLRHGGTFVTKVFRSADYNSLLFVLNKLFSKVTATKPKASRLESAEIFVVCQGYLAPATLDPRFLDAKYVFQDIQVPETSTLQMFLPKKKARDRNKIYDFASDVIMSKQVTVSQFVETDDPVSMVFQNNKIVWDELSQVRFGAVSTEDAREQMADLKLLGKGAVKELLRWRTKARAHAKLNQPAKKPKEEHEQREDAVLKPDELLTERLQHLAQAERAKERKERKRAKKRQRKLDRGIGLRDGDEFDYDREDVLFDMGKLTKETARPDKVQEEQLEAVLEAQYDAYKLRKSGAPQVDTEWKEKAIAKRMAAGLRDYKALSVVEANVWFSQPIFQGIVQDLSDDDQEADDSTPMNASDRLPLVQHLAPDAFEGIDDEDGFEVVPIETEADAEELDDGEEMARLQVLAMGRDILDGKTTFEKLEDDAYNKYAGMVEDNAPQWFQEDEKRHTRQVRVTDEIAQPKRINTRDIKKVVEAKARKRARQLKKMSAAGPKAIAIAENSEMGSREKEKAIGKLYAGTRKSDKQEKTYKVSRRFVVKGAKRSNIRGKRVGGKYKAVDGRMRADKRGRDSKSKSKKKKKR